eukprot:7387240-Prymnesium_polylepis.1
MLRGRHAARAACCAGGVLCSAGTWCGPTVAIANQSLPNSLTHGVSPVVRRPHRRDLGGQVRVGRRGDLRQLRAARHHPVDDAVRLERTVKRARHHAHRPPLAPLGTFGVLPLRLRRRRSRSQASAASASASRSGRGGALPSTRRGAPCPVVCSVSPV